MLTLRRVKKLMKRNRQRRGMTLIEIIVVIAILALLTAAVAVAVIPRLEEAKVDRAKLDIANIQNALKTYYVKKGGYPDTGAGLHALVDAQIVEKMPMDPWEHEYVYLNEGGKPVIISYGKDGTPGGAEYDTDLSSKDVAVPKK
jgi:general secretion pathway protein G